MHTSEAISLNLTVRLESEMKLIPIRAEDLPALERKLSNIPAPDYSGDKILDVETWSLVENIPTIVNHSEEHLVRRLREKDFKKHRFFFHSGRIVPFIALDQVAVHEMVIAQRWLFHEVDKARDCLEKFIQIYAPQGIGFQEGNSSFDIKGVISGLFGKTIHIQGEESTKSTGLACGGRLIDFSLEAGVPYLQEMVCSLLRCRQYYRKLSTSAAVLLSLGNSEADVLGCIKEKSHSAGLYVNAVNQIFNQLPFSKEELQNEEESFRKLLAFYNALKHVNKKMIDLGGYCVSDDYRYYPHVCDTVGKLTGKYYTSQGWYDTLRHLSGNTATLTDKLKEPTAIIDDELKKVIEEYHFRKPELALPTKINPAYNKHLLLSAPQL
ncbi:MAG: hypothetical protein AABX04_05400 [Nanoarchaeota archaeon]